MDDAAEIVKSPTARARLVGAVDTRWHLIVFAALAVALLCLLLERLLREQGYYTTRVFGGEFGFARIKSLTFLVWQGERFRFPFDALLFVLASISTGIAIVIAIRHFQWRRKGA